MVSIQVHIKFLAQNWKPLKSCFKIRNKYIRNLRASFIKWILIFNTRATFQPSIIFRHSVLKAKAYPLFLFGWVCNPLETFGNNSSLPWKLHAASNQQECKNVNQGHPQGGRGEYPPETKKIVVEKWCYFPELYKTTKIQEDGIEKGEEVNFPLRFLYVTFKIFSTNFNLRWFLAQTRKNLPLGF